MKLELFFRSKKKELVADILPYIASGALDNTAKLDAAIDYGQKAPNFNKVHTRNFFIEYFSFQNTLYMNFIPAAHIKMKWM